MSRDPPLPPATELLDLDLPEECLPGVLAALEALRDHLRNLEGFEVPE